MNYQPDEIARSLLPEREIFSGFHIEQSLPGPLLLLQSGI